MYPKFVRTSNVVRALEAFHQVKERGAREAGWLVAIGEPGLSKTRFLEYLAVQTGGILLRAKPDWTTQWLHVELAERLGLSAAGQKQELFKNIVNRQGGAEPVPIIIDEVENTRHNSRLLEVVRLISDTTETEVVIGGTEVALRFITRHPQLSSRVYATVKFLPATRADIRLMCDQLAEVKIADDTVERILADSRGYVREVKNAIGKCEAVGKLNPGRTVTAADVASLQLCTNRSALDPDGRGKR